MTLIVRTIVLLLLIGFGAVPASSQSLDIQSLPGDAPGAKVPFQFSTKVTVFSNQTVEVLVPVPAGSALTVETVTVRAIVLFGGLPHVRLLTTLGTKPVVRHTVALTRKGILEGDQVYEGTHAIRLYHRASTPPLFELWHQGSASGSSWDFMEFHVSVAGHVTGATRATNESLQQ